MTLPVPPLTLLQGASLFLDFDGTLVHLADQPDGVVVGEALLELLSGLQERLGGRLALISGRAADEVAELLHPFSAAVAGSHGLERGGEASEHAIRHADHRHVLERLRSLEQEQPGVLVEEKPFGFALHYRRAPDARELCHDAATAAAAALGMELQPGNMVIEVRPPGADKGTALKRFQREAPFAAGRPVFLGDDLTDEAAFTAAQELGGVGILVGEPRPTAARYGLADVDAVLRWLEQAGRELT